MNGTTENGERHLDRPGSRVQANLTALLSPALRGCLRGIEKADSLVWDVHKMLRTSALGAGGETPSS